MSGEKGPNWLGGKSFEPYNKFFNKRFKRLIKKRDKNKCVICGRREEYNQLSIHHIDYNKLNSIESNCITLCNSCHMKTNYNREFWKNYLSNLINQTIQPINQTL